ncbi:solute carrier family 25 member 45 isoform X2 [Procambarus clarkii]|uniref:solute carrier family 25 member 45 isoform X2 n=1 Tax=Procambarus clarkii TaxID=6728 RepID=UPI001E67092A|nr:solute carrier family 25 member 45-like isoform X2 [Procambarus clarkii]
MDKDSWIDFVAGWIGGCAGLLVGQPMDTIKVRQQTMTKMSSVSFLVRIFKYEGVRGFYKGMGFPLLAAGTLNSLFFGVYGNSLRWLSEGKARPSPADVMLAGCAGGVAQLFVACPVDLVKIKMQIQVESPREDGRGGSSSNRYRGPTACLQHMYKKGGVAGCYTGFNTMFFRDVIASGVYMAMYEWLVDYNPQPSAACTAWSGGVAGVISWATILPLDVIKSRIQADCTSSPQYKNAWDCVLKSYKADGVRVFTRGFWMMSVRAFPANGAILLGYVTSLNMMRTLVGTPGQDPQAEAVFV